MACSYCSCGRKTHKTKTSVFYSINRDLRVGVKCFYFIARTNLFASVQQIRGPQVALTVAVRHAKSRCRAEGNRPSVPYK